LNDTESAKDPVSMSVFRERLTDCDDIFYTDVTVGDDIKCTVLSVDGMVQTSVLNDDVLRPLALDRDLRAVKSERDAIELIHSGRVYHCQRKLCETMTDAMSQLLFGSAILVFDGEGVAIAFDIKGFESRSISEPTNENVLKGGKDAFVESLRTNTTLIRRRIQTNDLKIVQMTIGRRTNTPVAVVYVSGIANGAVVEAIGERLRAADIDGLVTMGQLDAILHETQRTIFPHTLDTELADKFTGNLLEGRVGIFVDGIPFGFLLPVCINSFMQAVEDYALHPLITSLFRILRYTAILLSLVLPALYIAITSFHQEIIPTKLAIAIITSKRGVPFPTYLEVFIMLLALEILLEAGARLPRAIGQAVSTVGALVIGQAAIAAHTLSPGVVIVIATAGITGFVVPSQDFSTALRLCRFGLAVAATIAGLFGMSIGLILILYNLCSIEVYGTPYLAPAVGNEWRQLFEDTIIRRGWRKKLQRPVSISPADIVRARETQDDESTPDASSDTKEDGDN
jgi:spore germination protein KA